MKHFRTEWLKNHLVLKVRVLKTEQYRCDRRKVTVMKGANVGDWTNGDVGESDLVCPWHCYNGENSTIKQIYGLLQLCFISSNSISSHMTTCHNLF